MRITGIKSEFYDKLNIDQKFDCWFWLSVLFAILMLIALLAVAY